MMMNHECALSEMIDAISAGELVFKSNERMKNGRNAMKIGFGDAVTLYGIVIRYGNLPDGRLDLADFSENFTKYAVAFNPDDYAVRLYRHFKKIGLPISLRGALDKANIKKSEILSVARGIENIAKFCERG